MMLNECEVREKKNSLPAPTITHGVSQETAFQAFVYLCGEF